jgi:hypothetical protein
MQGIIQAVHLYTYNLHDLSKFITEIFEIDMIHEDNESFFLINKVKFLVNEINDDTTRASHEGMRLFTLGVDSVEFLHEMKQKLEFYYYREGAPSSLFQGIVDIHQTPSSHYLDLIDPDGNIWTLDYRDQPLSHLPDINQNLTVEL